MLGAALRSLEHGVRIPRMCCSNTRHEMVIVVCFGTPSRNVARSCRAFPDPPALFVFSCTLPRTSVPCAYSPSLHSRVIRSQFPPTKCTNFKKSQTLYNVLKASCLKCLKFLETKHSSKIETWLLLSLVQAKG